MSGWNVSTVIKAQKDMQNTGPKMTPRLLRTALYMEPIRKQYFQSFIWILGYLQDQSEKCYFLCIYILQEVKWVFPWSKWAFDLVGELFQCLFAWRRSQYRNFGFQPPLALILGLLWACSPAHSLPVECISSLPSRSVHFHCLFCASCSVPCSGNMGPSIQ